MKPNTFTCFELWKNDMVPESFFRASSSPFANLDSRTLPFAATEKAQKNGGKTFLRFEDTEVSYSDFHKRTNRVANSFQDLGVEKNDKVAILMSNRPEFLYVWMGLAKAGAVEVPIYPDYKGEMLLYRLEYSDAKLLVTEPEFLQTIGLIQRGVTKIKQIVLASGVPKENPLDAEKFRIYPFGKLLKGSSAEVDRNIMPGDPFALIFTSGTTGPPKGALLPHAWNFYAAEHKIDAMQTGPDDVIFNCFSMCNPTGLLETTFTAMMADATVAHVKRFSASNFWSQCNRLRATEFVYMGGILSFLLKQPEDNLDMKHSVRAAWGAGCSKQVWLDFERRFGVKIVEIYGTTETMEVLQTPPDAPRPGSCGKVVDGWEVTILNEDDVELSPDEIGEIVVRPMKPFMMFLGYYKDPEGTLEVCRNLWFHTGDLGYRDNKGYFNFYQRKKYAMRLRGRMVSSWEIEQTINSHLKVKESAAFGVASETGEEECKVIVVLKEREEMKPEELLSFCNERMPRYMLPRYIDLTHEELRKTHTQRIVVWEYKKEGIGRAWDALKASRRLRG